MAGLDGLIDNLNEVPAALLAQARALSSFHEARSLLNARTTAACTPYIIGFVRDVVFGGADAAQWRRGRTLVPDLDLSTLLTADRDRLLSGIAGPVSHRVRPDRQDWEAGVGSTGAPAQAEPKADYRSTPPPATIALRGAVLEAVTDTGIALRRWIASRLARAAVPVGERQSWQDFLLPPGTAAPPDWSEDAVAAAQALWREQATFGPTMDATPGFRGPDGWFGSPVRSETEQHP